MFTHFSHFETIIAIAGRERLFPVYQTEKPVRRRIII